MQVRRRCWKWRALVKSLHPPVPKAGKKSRALQNGGVLIAIGVTALLTHTVEIIEPWWVRWALILAVGLSGAVIVSVVKPKPQPAWVAGPGENETVVFSSYWPGDVGATPEAIRAAMLTALRTDLATAGVIRPKHRTMRVENHREGWMIQSWGPNDAKAMVAHRAGGQTILDPPKGLGKILALQGDYFTFDEAKRALLKFAENGATPSWVRWEAEK